MKNIVTLVAGVVLTLLLCGIWLAAIKLGLNTTEATGAIAIIAGIVGALMLRLQPPGGGPPTQVAVVLLALLVGGTIACGSGVLDTRAVHPDGTPTLAMVRETCGSMGVLCVPAETAVLTGAVEDVTWGRVHYRELDMVAVSDRAGVILYEYGLCRRQPVACRWVLRHEKGHLVHGPDQTEADCWAAAHSTPEENAAGYALLEQFRQPQERLAALKGCTP